MIERITEDEAERMVEEVPLEKRPILRYVLNVQQHGTSMLAYPVERGADVTPLTYERITDDEGEIQLVPQEQHHRVFEVVQQVTPSHGQFDRHHTVTRLPGLTKIYTDHIIYIEETDYELVEEENNDERNAE